MRVTKVTKFFWVDAAAGSSWNERKGIITTALESGAKGVIVRSEDAERAAKLGNIALITEEEGKGDVVLIGKNSEGDATLELPEELKNSVDLSRIKELKKKGLKTCGYVEIRSKQHERLAALEARAADFILVVGKDWAIIPLENLIAELQKEKVEVLAGVKNSEEARLALETLEIGVDGVLLQSSNVNEIKKVAELCAAISEKLVLKAGKVRTLKPLGMGDRVCIDTASLLAVGEGMLIGSQANGLFLIHSETLETEYVASRPFRVNAGAVHAYVLTPDKKTKYLSELKTGDEVLAVDGVGNTRSVVIGRVKIEKRPLMLVEAECEGKVYKTLLQNAETIMLVGKDGKPVSISKLKVGDEILTYTEEVGRHFGMEVEESIIER
ncbi:MAG: 3-dehydroquinate synthase II [Candidatus Hydrothermarchaeota archaeon]|nr:3-dehydroquinate synthase II [Candidatus Hydrothermarchaeota archaeon]